MGKNEILRKIGKGVLCSRPMSQKTLFPVCWKSFLLNAYKEAGLKHISVVFPFELGLARCLRTCLKNQKV